MPQWAHWADTKFLYFVGQTVPSATGHQPLILDRVLARRLRSLAETVGRESGHDPDDSIANWVWRDRNWSPHRYAAYLCFMHAAPVNWPPPGAGRPTQRRTCSNTPCSAPHGRHPADGSTLVSDAHS
ncbi:8-oxoguanine DNA glycosylase OGG fold protein [Streptomyces sp. NPDC002755]